MSMSKSERLQVLVEPEQQARLQSVARLRGVSVAAVVREAIEREIGRAGQKRRDAARVLLSAPPVSVPSDLAELEREIASEYDEHA
jgi:hypothetical protein